ncbi:MAG: CotH kinase family protein, partial [Planctomycetes bacterium]|nr:CotH kinase family protein [Planctomycetota bacterium]
IAVGSHTISFSDVADYSKPADVPVTVADGQTEVVLAGAYIPDPGSITVEITAPVPSGAQWRVDGGAWQLSEEIVGGLSAGGSGHLVEYDVVTGYDEPAAETITLAPGEDVAIIRSYVQQTGTLTVTISPQEAIDAGAQWRVDPTGPWYDSGDEITLVLDIYMVEFLLVSGWQNPGTVEVEIFDDTQATVSRAYSPIQTVTLQINEYMASNNAAASDPQGQFDDWFEIYNSTGSDVEMGGMYVADSANIWQIPVAPPETTIPAGGYLLFWADNDTLDGPLHVGFQLNADGDSLALYDTDGLTLIDSVTIGNQITDVSYGRYLDGTPDFYYFDIASPGTTNDTQQTFAGQVADTKFSHDRGFYDASFAVTITTDTPGAMIYYTLDDGSDPINPDGTPTSTAYTYTGPVTITTTKSLRAAAVKTGWLPTNIDTQTYIFLDDVLLQDGTGLLPHDNNWGEFGPDWEMDPTVISTEPFIDDDGLSFTVKDALVAAPTLALTMNWDEWFDTSQGIYISGEGDERICSAEFISPDGSEDGFQVNCTVQIVGGSSPSRWKMDKLSMRLKFRPRLDDGTPTGGPGRLRYDLFADSKIDSFNTIVLDARMNMSWAYGGNSIPAYQRLHAQYTRDQFPGDIHNDMGGYSPHGRPVHLYLNDVYWGLYFIHERPDGAFAASYFGGEKDDYDVLKHDPGVSNVVGFDDDPVAKQLAADNYQALSIAANQDLSDTGNYQAVLDLLDVDDFIDYMITNFYVGNTDWAHHNWYASRSRVDPAGLWRYHNWDPEHCMKSITENVTTKDNGDGSPTDLHRDLRANDDYRRLFGDHIHKHFFNDGLLTPAAIAQLYQKQLDQIDRVVVAESVRWGDNQENESGITYTRDAYWIPERDRLWNDYFPQRSDIVLGQLKSDGLYPDTEATVFNINGSYQHGGYILAGDSLTMDDPYLGGGTIYYTLDGSDPRFDPGAAASSIAPASDPPALTDPPPAVITNVVRADGSSGNRSPIGVFDGNTQCLPSDAGGLADGIHVYSDRDYPYSLTPVVLIGSEYIRTFNTDKDAADTVTYTVTTSALAEVWIAVDDRFSGLQNRVDLAVANFAAAGVFQDTGLNVHVNESATNPARPLSVFSAELLPGTYVFKGGTVNSNNFYTIGAINIDPTLNRSPVVDAGLSQTLFWPNDTAVMDATATDDNKPDPPNSLSLEWSLDSAPAGVTFGQLGFSPNEFDEDPQITFPQTGTYVLRLSADDTELIGTDTVTISVIDPPTSTEYTGPISLTDSVRVKACVLYNNEWSALNEAVYATDYAINNLRITELMYHPTDATQAEKDAAGDQTLIDEDFEFIELKNIGTAAINLNLVHFTDGIDFTFGDYWLGAEQF